MTWPEGFWWGTGASSTQCEGAAPNSDWAAWELAGRAPPSGQGNGFATQHADDFRLYAAHGLTHHRLSIEWARIEPVPGKRDPEAIDHYRAVLEAARAAGVAPWVCFHHFTIPGWFADEGSFRDDKARGYYWPRHVAFCAETFGDLVEGWKPINEPMAYALLSHLVGVFPPGKRDLGQMYETARGMLLAQRDAWRELRGGGRPVATIHNLPPIFPADDSVPAERNAQVMDTTMWQLWMRADRDGIIELPGRGPEEVADLRECADLIGFSYYNAFAVDREFGLKPYPPNARVGPMGYAPWPEGLGLVLRRIDEELPGRPILVCELGLGTPANAANPIGDDEWRQDYLRESLAIVEEAIADGIDIRGLFFWTGVDNYEWTYGYTVQFGLFTKDREPRPSAAVVRSLIQPA